MSESTAESTASAAPPVVAHPCPGAKPNAHPRSPLRSGLLALALVCASWGCGDGESASSDDEGTNARDTARGESGGRPAPDAAAVRDSGSRDASPDAATGSDTDAGDASMSDAGSPPAARDTSTTDAGGGGGSDASGAADGGEPCVSQTYDAGSILRPVDIIWAIDASPSMGTEIDIIETQLNDFAARIGDSGLDYRVVLIGSDRAQSLPAEAHEFFEICIPPPLSAAATCPDVDSDRFLHVREPIHSRAVLRESLETFSQYRDFLRPSAVKHFVYVSDDDERRASAADDFRALVASEPVIGERVHVHSIVDFIGYDPSCPFDETLCSCGDARGQVYLDLSEATDGLTASICEDDWSPIFDALEERVTDVVEVPCEFLVPDPGEAYEVDFRAVSVRTPSGSDVSRVADAGACGGEGGWYFDDPASPRRVLLCPASCGDSVAGLQIELECVRDKV